MGSTNLSFQSTYGYQRQQTTTRHAVTQSGELATPLKDEMVASMRAAAAQRMELTQEVNSSAEVEITGAEAAEESISIVEQRFQRMINVLERMFGVKVELYKGPDPNEAQGGGYVPSEEGSEQNAPQQRQLAVAMREYHHVTESESSSVAIQGKLNLNDGRELNVDFSLDMSRTRKDEYWGEMVITGRQLDPLVVNLNGNAAQLTNQRQAFDLDGDGVEEQVAFATGDSAFLAIDKNGNGEIDDGNELFGPKSGSGFADLAQYDSNKDGLIDSLDDIWQELALVQRDEDGNESLLSLKDVGISAFVLERTRSPFSLFNDQGERTGVIRETGLYVKDNGSVDSLQHVDLMV